MPVGAAPTTSSFSTQHLASLDWAKTTAKRREEFKFWNLVGFILRDSNVALKFKCQFNNGCVSGRFCHPNSYLWPYSQPLPLWPYSQPLPGVQIQIKQWNSTSRAAQFYFSLQTIYLLDLNFGLDFIDSFYIYIGDCCFIYRYSLYHFVYKSTTFVQYWFEIL